MFFEIRVLWMFCFLLLFDENIVLKDFLFFCKILLRDIIVLFFFLGRNVLLWMNIFKEVWLFVFLRWFFNVIFKRILVFWFDFFGIIVLMVFKDMLMDLYLRVIFVFLLLLVKVEMLLVIILVLLLIVLFFGEKL